MSGNQKSKPTGSKTGAKPPKGWRRGQPFGTKNPRRHAYLPNRPGVPEFPSGQYPAWVERFLEALTEHPNIRRACQLAGVSRTEAYKNRTNVPAFREAWDACIQDGIDRLEEAGINKVLDGNSDLLTIFFLKHLRPRVYMEKIVIDQHVHMTGGPQMPQIVGQELPDYRVAVRALKPPSMEDDLDGEFRLLEEGQ
jgi:hypothetical protein